MTFKVKIKNIGKLTAAEIRIGRFTVFAGPNNTGKSFVSKLLYSLFNAMNTDHVRIYLRGLSKLTGEKRFDFYGAPNFSEYKNSMREQIEKKQGNWLSGLGASIKQVKQTLETLKQLDRPDDQNSPISSLSREIENLEAHATGCAISDSKKWDKIIPGLISQMEKVEKIANSIGQGEQQTEIDNVKNSLVDLRETLSQTDVLTTIGVLDQIQQNLIQNFQVPRLSDLRGEKNTSSEIDIEKFGDFKFSDEEVRFKINLSSSGQLQHYSNVIYLESPVYWKLKSALEDAHSHPGYLYEGNRERLNSVLEDSDDLWDRSDYWGGNRERLSGVPRYFHDLARALKFEYTGNIAFPGVYEKLTGKDVVGGKIKVSEIGNLSFQENGRSFPLPVTAMGIANLGILALLIERKVLDENAFVFIDEPEAHLHPAWQVIMAEALFELSRQGVNVVIATHSVDILKWLEVQVKKNPADKQLIALNQFPVKGSGVDEDFETRMAKIKQELTKPFSDLYLEGV